LSSENFSVSPQTRTVACRTFSETPLNKSFGDYVRDFLYSGMNASYFCRNILPLSLRQKITRLIIPAWIWRQQCPPKHLEVSSRPHFMTSGDTNAHIDRLKDPVTIETVYWCVLWT